MVNPIPDGYPRVTPYLIVDGAAAAIDFYTTVLGAAAHGERMEMPDGKVGHAELSIGDSLIMIADEYPDHGALSPRTVGGSPVTIHLYVEDVDAVFAAALANGAVQTRPVTDEFYGDRIGSFTDPWGHLWSVASHIEDVTFEEMAERAKAAMA